MNLPPDYDKIFEDRIMYFDDDFIKSLLAKYDESGVLPVWELSGWFPIPPSKGPKKSASAKSWGLRSEIS